HGLRGFLGTDQGLGESALDVDAVGMLCGGSLEIGDRLVRVAHRQHHVVEVAFVDDVHVLDRAFDFGIGGLLAGGHCCRPCQAEGNQDGVAHLMRPLLLLPQCLVRSRYCPFPRLTRENSPLLMRSYDGVSIFARARRRFSRMASVWPLSSAKARRKTRAASAYLPCSMSTTPRLFQAGTKVSSSFTARRRSRSDWPRRPR